MKAKQRKFEFTNIKCFLERKIDRIELKIIKKAQ